MRAERHRCLVGSRSSTESEFLTVGRTPTEKARRPSVLLCYVHTVERVSGAGCG